jgi:hypothetical protein
MWEWLKNLFKISRAKFTLFGKYTDNDLELLSHRLNKAVNKHPIDYTKVNRISRVITRMTSQKKKKIKLNKRNK